MSLKQRIYLLTTSYNIHRSARSPCAREAPANSQRIRVLRMTALRNYALNISLYSIDACNSQHISKAITHTQMTSPTINRFSPGTVVGYRRVNRRLTTVTAAFVQSTWRQHNLKLILILIS